MTAPGFELDTRNIGGLPLLNRFRERLRLDEHFERHVPSDPRSKVATARVLSVFVRNLVLARVPLYGLQEWAGGWVPALLGLSSEDDVALLNDDRAGRALDRLFDADRSALLTDLVVGAVREFDMGAGDPG